MLGNTFCDLLFRTMREVRRKDRLLDEQRAKEVIYMAEYGFLAMINTDGGGYGIPLNFVIDEDENLYFHCAPEGHQLENLRDDNRVTFTIAGKTEVQRSKFT